MTETFQSPPHGTPPERDRPTPEDEEARERERDAAVATATEGSVSQDPPPGTPQDDAAGKGSASNPSTIDAEQERLVWTPPLPQYPARPTREEPVQYQAPRPQPAPPYIPQTYVPPRAAQPPPAPPPPQAPPPPNPAMQQPAYAPAIASGYSAPVARPYDSYGQVVTSPPAPRASKARVSRRMARRMVRGADRARKAIFEVRPGLVFAFLLVLLLTGWFAYDKWIAGSVGSGAANNGGTVTLPPETPTVQAYLTAVQKGDTDAVWNALGAQEKAHRISRGDDKSVLDAVLKMQQQNGFTYTAYHYVAGYAKDGTTDPSKGGIYMYVADVGTGTRKTSVPMVFVMDDKGQISQVTDQLYDYVLQQLKGN